MPNSEMSNELKAALDAARAAAEVIRGFYQRNVKIEVKADKTPVTEADVRSEEAIRDLLTKRFPSYGFYGEETGKSDMNAESVWLVDPIDGTKSFVRECPFFSTQIALMRGGRFVLGVSSAPAYDELAWAERGRGAFLNGKRIRVSKVAALDGAIVSTGNLKTLAASPAWPRFGGLIGSINRIRGYGDFVHYHLLARAALDVVIESDVNILDIAALTVIVEEAGGRFTDLKGADVDLATTTRARHQRGAARSHPRDHALRKLSMSVFLRWGIFGILGFAALMYAYNASKQHGRKAAARAAPRRGRDRAARGARARSASRRSEPAVAPAPHRGTPPHCAVELVVAQRALAMRATRRAARSVAADPGDCVGRNHVRRERLDEGRHALVQARRSGAGPRKHCA